MSTVLLTVTHTHPGLHELVRLVQDELARAGEEEVRRFDLSEAALGKCHGEFDCWLETPGGCQVEDGERQLLHAIHDAHNLVLVDEVTFGGHGSTLKHALDRVLCMLLPFLERRVTLTHHGLRYERPFALFALGFAPTRNVPMADTFRSLAEANAHNLVAPHVGADVFVAGEQGRWPAQLSSLFAAAHTPDDEARGRATLRSELVQLARADTRAALPPPRTAALLVGSARTSGGGVSECLAQAAASRLSAAGLRVSVHRVNDLADDRAEADQVARTIAAAELFQLVTPLYVDALPAQATRALETVAAIRARSVPPARFSMVVQSGFPEPEHNRHAVAIARHFGAAAGYHWSGALALGGGAVVDPALPLDAQEGPVAHVRRALDLACASLARGGVIDVSAIQTLLRTPMPAWMQRGAGNLGFRLSAQASRLKQRAGHRVSSEGPAQPPRRGSRRARANA